MAFIRSQDKSSFHSASVSEIFFLVLQTHLFGLFGLSSLFFNDFQLMHLYLCMFMFLSFLFVYIFLFFLFYLLCVCFVWALHFCVFQCSFLNSFFSCCNFYSPDFLFKNFQCSFFAVSLYSLYYIYCTVCFWFWFLSVYVQILFFIVNVLHKFIFVFTQLFARFVS